MAKQNSGQESNTQPQIIADSDQSDSY